MIISKFKYLVPVEDDLNLDLILGLLFDHYKKIKDKVALLDEASRLRLAKCGYYAKESLIVDFINQINLDTITDKASFIDAFFQFAQGEQQREINDLIITEHLNAKATECYIANFLRHGYTFDGPGIHDMLPKVSPLNPQYLTKKQNVYRRITFLVKKFKGIAVNKKGYEDNLSVA
jgi:type I restriction enzyme R subunit